MAGQDKTEKATPQRLREARRRGDIPSSPEFTAALLALVSLFALQQQGMHIFTGLQGLLSQGLVAVANPRQLTNATIGAQLTSDLANGLLLLAPFAVITVVGAIVIGALNTRGLVSFKPLSPSLHKLNPLKGIKRLFSKEALILLLKAFVKLVAAIVLVQAWSPAWQALVPVLPAMGVGPAMGAMWQQALQVALQITVAYVLIAAIDLGYRYFSWYRRHRMTKQEVKEEFRRSEGNPQVRSRMRQIGRKRLRALMNGMGMRRVPQADVVITNPTHFAVAVQYKAGSMRAPRVIAKGQNLVALRIKDIARKHNVPIVENKPLAQALFKTVEVNQEIPADLYRAVAQVLAFVYRMRSPAQRAMGASRRAQPQSGAPLAGGR